MTKIPSFPRVWLVAWLLLAGLLFGTPTAAAGAVPGLERSGSGPVFVWEHPDDIGPALADLMTDAPELVAPIYAELGIAPVPGVVVRVAERHAEFLALAPEGMRFPPWAQGITLPSRNEIYLTLFDAQGNLVDLPKVFMHEVSHVAVFAAAARGRAPRWFVEGFAILQAGEDSLGRVDALANSTMREGVSLRMLDKAFHGHAPSAGAAYAAAADFVRYYREVCGRDALARTVGTVRGGGEFYAAMGEACGSEVTFAGLEAGWHATLVERYPWWRVLATDMVLWVGGAVMLVFGFFAVRRRNRERLARWEEAEYRYDSSLDRSVAAAEERERRRSNVALRQRRGIPPPGRGAEPGERDDDEPPGGWLH